VPRPRPTSSAQRAPLDFVLGTQGAVRVLRVLSATQVPLSQAELARRAKLTLSALPSLLQGLEASGIVTYVGRGRTRQVQLHTRHPLVSPLMQLFRDERSRWQRIENDLRAMIRTIVPGALSAWLEGPVAESRDRFSDPLVVAVLADSTLPLDTQEALRRQSNALQGEHHVIVALRLHQRADLVRFTPAQRKALEQVVLLFGPAPLDLSGRSGAPSHAKARNDEQLPKDASRRRPTPAAIGAAIADQLLREPELVERARASIERRLSVATPTERLALLEWQGLLDSLTVAQLAAVLREESERADTLRQNQPFALDLATVEALTAAMSKKPTSKTSASKRSARKKAARSRAG
jgi:IclR-like helix-turn-helix domain-containing protein